MLFVVTPLNLRRLNPFHIPMNWSYKMLSSSIGQKILMSLTGLFLCSFLVIHLIGNIQLLNEDGGLSFNQYTVFMTTSPLIKAISYLLYFTIVFHAYKGLVLAFRNKQARTSKYAISPGNSTSFWASRWMGVLGTIILVFIVVHMSEFWFEYKFGQLPYKQYEVNLSTGEPIAINDYNQPITTKMVEYIEGNSKIVVVKDIYGITRTAFKNPFIVLLYVFSMGAIAFHLIHGFKSAFQTLGLNHSKYNPLIRFLGLWVFGILIPLAFAVLPVYIFFS